MRSKLFVPGNRPALFAKALASAAEMLSFDLEDAVAGDDKGSARTQVAAFLRGVPHRAADKQVVVRVNAWHTSGWVHHDHRIPSLRSAELRQPDGCHSIRGAGYQRY